MNLIKKRKGQIRSTIVKIALLLLFLVAVIMIFFGDGLLKEGFDKVRALISGVPEIDPTQDQMDFFRRNDAQIKFLSSWNNAINNALAGQASMGGCIMTLQSLEEDGFYKKGENYNLYFDQEGKDISISLTRYAKQDYEKTSSKTEVPVTTATITDAKLCVIEGTSADAFYEEFNDINAGETPDITKISPIPINHLIISSGKEEDRDMKRSVGYSTWPAKPANISDYDKWGELFKKKDRTIIYALRIDNAGQKYLCFFPAYNDFIGSCNAPKNNLMQIDCFDADAEKRSIKYNLEQNPPLIPSHYICSDTPPVLTQVTGTANP